MATTTPSTPPSKPQSQLPPDTVPVQRFASRNGYRTGDLSLGREAVLKDLRMYLQIPYTDLIRSVFNSPLPDVEHVCNKLVENDLLNSTSQWTRFTNTPAQSKASENVTFQPLVDIISKIFDQVSNRDVLFTANPAMIPLSERRNTSRPDAFILHERPAAKEGRTLDSSRPIHWFDIAIPFEFKKTADPSSKRDNEQKIIWSLHNIMREDPLRRFALGVTIEDVNMRLWCNNRAFVAVSEPINFCTEIDNFVRFFYLIGKMTDVQLGWDPTVERIVREGYQYKFTVCGHVYTTTAELATYGADVMIGRGTRVYKAQDEAGNVVAIKDSWREEDRDAEGAILGKIFSDIRDKLGQEEAMEAEKYFVKVRAYEDVVISGEHDKTFRPDGKDLPWIKIDTGPFLSDRTHLSSTGNVPVCLDPPKRARLGSLKAIPCRIHTRTIFEDVGIPVMDVRLLADNFSCLSDARQALYYLHKAGWVHRDFSVGNVIWVAKDGQRTGKLTDFEYAKSVDSDISHDVRTGTMQFLAVEVEAQKYLFEPESSCSGDFTPAFRMNFLHDLESLWWAAVWVLFHHTDANSPTEVSDDQLKYFNEAFPPIVGQTSRHFFFARVECRHGWRTLSTTYRDACRKIIDLVFELRDCYREAEKYYPDIKLDDRLLKRAHDGVLIAFSDVVGKLKSSGVYLLPLHDLWSAKRSSNDNRSEQTMKRVKLG